MLCIFLLSCGASAGGSAEDVLDAAEREWLTQNRGRVVLAWETGYAPFVFSAPNGQPNGLAEDHMVLLESKLGVRFERKQYSSLDEILTKARAGEVQIVNAVTETPERSGYLAFTKPFIAVPNVVVVRKERPGHLSEVDLAGMKVSLVRSYAVTEYLLGKHPGVVPDLVADDASALVNVSFARSDAAVIDLATASYLIERKGITNLRVAGEVERGIQLAIGSTKSEPMLHRVLQKGLDATTEAERRELRDRWISPSGPSILADWRLWGGLGGGLTVVLGGIAVVVLWNRTLRRQVTTRTEELAREKEQVAVTLGSIANGVVCTDLAGNVTSMNAAAEQLSGWTSATAVGRPLGEVLIGVVGRNGEPRRAASTRSTKSDDPSVIQDTAVLVSRSGGERHVVTSAAPIRSGPEAPSRGTVLVIQDVTEHKVAEEERERLQSQLRQAQKMEAIGHLAGGVAHDFNNLLQVILGNLELLRIDLPQGLPGVAALDDASDAAQRAAELTQQLLAFGRRQVIQPVAVDLNALVSGVLKMTRRVIGEHIELRFRPGEGLGTVQIDKGQFEQVLMNLCINARDAMPNGGTLTIETENVAGSARGDELPFATAGAHVLLRVTDTGSGMDEATRAQVFEPFFTTKAVGRGTGLGLATVYGIIKQHNGSIRVESEPGKGTMFQIWIPSVPDPLARAEPEPRVPVAGGTETILIAEDEEQILRLLRATLQRAGYRVLVASDGEEAMRVFDENADAVDLALLDVIMPRLGGEEVMERIQERRSRVRFLFSSGYSENGIHADFVIRKGLRLINKPHGERDLLRAVREALDSPDP